MSYRISYGPRRRRRWLWGLAAVPAAVGVYLLSDGRWYWELARYVGAAIRGH